MTQLRPLLLPLVLGALVTGCTVDDGVPDEDVGSATIEITRAPDDARCLRIRVEAAARHVEKLYDLTPGQASVFHLEGLPVGQASFTGAAFAGTCAGVNDASTPNWLSDPTPAIIRVFDVVHVVLHMFQNGRASVGVDFDPGNGPTLPPHPDTPGVHSSSGPYLLPVAPGVQTRAILTVGDSPNAKPDGTPYRMVGIPDGLGAYDNGDGTFTLLSNHELVASSGTVRAHGGIGAFVSRWIIRASDLAVLHGEDLIKQVVLWNAATSSYAAPATGVAFARFCSADLPAWSAFFNGFSGLGYDGRLFLDGEENSDGRGFAHALDGTSYELPRLGKLAFENLLANPDTGDTTVVAITDDSTPGQVYVYVGHKTASASPVDRAGLTNGALYGVKVAGIASEPGTGIVSGTSFTLASLGNVDSSTAAQLETASNAAGVTTFQRPEDGHWDPGSPNDFYFVTTASFTGTSRLWRLRFVDAENPTLGGHIDMLLDGTEGQKMLDNLTIDRRGHVLLEEDVGNQEHLGRVLRYDLVSDALTVIATADPALFSTGAGGFLTKDEEGSGIIDAADLLGDGWFLLDLQAHYNRGDVELVEGGQFLAIYDPATLL